jgi:hypothetical protein
MRANSIMKYIIFGAWGWVSDGRLPGFSTLRWSA